MIEVPGHPEADESKRLIGDFIINFENCTHYIRGFIVSIFDGVNSLYADVLVAELEARILTRSLLTLIAEKFREDEDKSIMIEAISAFEELIEARNKVAHGTWIIGNYKVTENSTFLPIDTAVHKKSYLTKKGLERRVNELSNEELNKLVEWTKNYLNVIYHLSFKFNNLKIRKVQIEESLKKLPKTKDIFKSTIK